MGWTESGLKTNRRLIQAIKDMREKLGESQVVFAERLGLSKRAVVNYEKDQRPTTAVLARLARAANEADMPEHALTFVTEIGLDVGLMEINMLQVFGNESRGYLFAHYEGEQGHDRAMAFYRCNMLLTAHDVDSEIKAKAENVMDRYTNDVGRLFTIAMNKTIARGRAQRANTQRQEAK